MKILYADSVDESRLGPLVDAGHEVAIDPSLTAADLPAAISGVDVLVVRSTNVTTDTIEAADRLGLIVRAGAGTDNIDKVAASAKAISVSNVPGRNAVAVAELSMALLLAVDRRIPDNTADLRAGIWDKRRYTQADGLYGKRMAIIGLGDIGMAVAERAKAFGLTVSAIRNDGRSASAKASIRRIGIRMVDTTDDLLADADVVSLHIPATAETTGMVDAHFLAALPDGAILINTSRGDIVDSPALLAALDAGTIRAGLDVWPDEPSSATGAFESALARHPAVVGTHHIGASTSQAQRSVADGTVKTIEAYIDGKPINCVNLRSEPSGNNYLMIRHLDRVGVLAQIFAALRAGGLNVQQMQNQVFDGGKAAVATIHVSDEPSPSVVAAVGAIDEVLNVSSVNV